jgi:hypothetical protein
MTASARIVGAICNCRGRSAARRSLVQSSCTTLIDLMKIDVLTPDTLMDIIRLPLRSIAIPSRRVSEFAKRAWGS